jgi:hypothetical protein
LEFAVVAAQADWDKPQKDSVLDGCTEVTVAGRPQKRRLATVVRAAFARPGAG